jgi:hypothetical protein
VIAQQVKAGRAGHCCGTPGASTLIETHHGQALGRELGPKPCGQRPSLEPDTHCSGSIPANRRSDRRGLARAFRRIVLAARRERT